MNRSSTPVVFAFLLMVLSALGADSSPKLPPYPDQPRINDALHQLTEAQKKMGGSGGSQADALIHLKKAQIALEGAANNKGSFRATAIRCTGQAIKYLEKSDTDKAGHEISEALEAVHKAGKAGAK